MNTKKKIVTLSLNTSGRNAIHDYLNTILKDYAEITSILVESTKKEDLIKADLVVFSVEEVYYKRPDLLENSNYVISKRTINYKNLVEIFSLEDGLSVYVVNDTELSTKETILHLEEIGITQYNLIPFYPGCLHQAGTISAAISIGEPQLVPKDIQRVIDIGNRVIDISSVCEIITKLNLSMDLINEFTVSYLKDFIEIIKLSNKQLHSINKSQTILKNTFENTSSGMCVINQFGIIQMFNQKFKSMLTIDEKYLIEKDLFKILSSLNIEFNILEIMANDQIIKNALNTEVLISSYEVSFPQEKLYIVYANYTEDIYKKEISIRKTINLNKPLVKYKFADYLTNDEDMKRVLGKAKKIAANDSCVLIQGESGTGKEIIAQSIHYSSSRKNYPFVPINFASIQPSLLESELFGYEDGSFTGAKKGGKKGLLEMAHKGTIFFDEIGDAPLSSQTALLRVLQESEIRRVGGTDIIPIDVRVIVATNKNLWDKVNEGSFREDLFYRINVMPIDTIPLRDRKNDLELILNFYLKNKFNDDSVTLENLCTKDLQAYLLSYPWPGNVREIINICEYFACTKSANKLGVLDLPKYIVNNTFNNSTKISPTEKSVLGLIENEPKIGRGRLLEACSEEKIELTEGKIRSIITSLAEKKLITVNKTKGGCEITELGKSIIQFP